MAHLTLKNVLKVMKLMEQCESAMEELYGIASRTWPEDRQVFLELSLQEKKHAGYVMNIIDLISKNPGEFRPGRPFSEESANEFMARILSVIQDIRRSAISKATFISFVLNAEQRLIESNYSQIVITDNTQYKGLAKEIDSETATHKAQLSLLKKA